MIPEKLFQQLLMLGDAWRVKAVDYVEPQRKVVIRVEETPQLWASQTCPHCEAASVAGYALRLTTMKRSPARTSVPQKHDILTNRPLSVPHCVEAGG